MALSTAVPPSAVARVVGVETRFLNLQQNASSFLPQRVAVVGQGSDLATYTTTPVQVFTAAEVGTTFGFGSPLHLASKQLFPINDDGIGAIPVTLYPLDPAGGAVAAAGDVTLTGTQTNAASYQIRVSGIVSDNVLIPATTTAAAAVALFVTAINAQVDMPVIAVDGTLGVLDLTSKWAGESGNDIFIEVLGIPDGIAFAVTQPTAGATNPDVDLALANINSIWETMVLNCLNSTDTTSLDKYKSWGEGRLDPLTNKTAIVFSGSVATDTVLLAAGALRTTDRINSLIPVEASPNLPLQIVARALSRIAPLANSNPPNDYAGLELSGIIAGDESTRWTYAQRDVLVKAGISTVQIIDGAPRISDTVTFYHPVGEEPPAFRYVVDIVKLQNIQFSTEVIFANAEWDGVPLLNDDDVTINPTAKKPKDAVAVISSMIRGLGLNAIIADVEAAVATVAAEIDGTNPKRLNATFTVKLSGNANIISVDLNFGFNFGGSV